LIVPEAESEWAYEAEGGDREVEAEGSVERIPADRVAALGRENLTRKLRAKGVARPEGVEPPAYRFEACRSIQLSYGRSEKPLTNSD
jgi:hypothetical protein